MPIVQTDIENLIGQLCLEKLDLAKRLKESEAKVTDLTKLKNKDPDKCEET